MSYPTEILPKLNYKIIDCELGDHYLIRFIKSNDPNEIFHDGTKDIKFNLIFERSLDASDLSTSLLGVFKRDFIKICFTEKGRAKFQDYCQPNIQSETPMVDEDYFIKDDRGFWVALIKDLDGAIANYESNVDNNPKLTAICKVTHTPMLWNFWHFSIRWHTTDGDAYLSDASERRLFAKRFKQEILTIIAEIAKFDEPNFTTLNEEHYTINITGKDNLL